MRDGALDGLRAAASIRDHGRRRGHLHEGGYRRNRLAGTRGGNFRASPLAAGGRIYFVGDDGVTTVIEASPDFKVLTKNPLGEKVQASPALSQGQFFIRTEKNLSCIDAGSAAGFHQSIPSGSSGRQN